jgi:hypothetical protein
MDADHRASQVLDAVRRAAESEADAGHRVQPIGI